MYLMPNLGNSTFSLKGIDVEQLTKKDWQYFQMWERSGMDKAHLDAWAAVIPEDQTSRLQLVQHCRQTGPK